MKKTIFLLLLSLSLNAQVFQNVNDKDMHKFMSANLTCKFASDIDFFTDRPVLAAIAGAGMSLGVGYIKERFIDKTFSKDDMFANAWGSGSGIVMYLMGRFYIKEHHYPDNELFSNLAPIETKNHGN